MTLTLEALSPFAFKTSGSTKTLKLGERFHLPKEKAEKLLRLAGGKVRMVVQDTELEPGMWVQFHSPLFGDCSAQVQAVEVNQLWITQHSVLKQPEPVRIPTAWIR